MKVQFKDIIQIKKFCKAAENYDGNVTISDGSIEVDAESIVGVINLGLHKVLNVNMSDRNSASAIQFESEVAKLGIERN